MHVTHLSANMYTTVNLSIMRLVNHLCSKVLYVNYAYRNLHSVLLLSVGYKSIRAYVYNRYYVREDVALLVGIYAWPAQNKKPLSQIQLRGSKSCSAVNSTVQTANYTDLHKSH
jgi:hypothetical protein